jgi:class 3 adenylate cyclase
VAFIDLSDRAGVYAALGKAQASSVISRIGQWIGRVCQAHGGRVVPCPGEGVLASFADGSQAVRAVIFMQCTHIERMQKWPKPLRMDLKIGMASGPASQAQGHQARGEAVDCATALAELAGAGEIWADQSLDADLHAASALAGQAVRYHALGWIGLPGMEQERPVFRIDWGAHGGHPSHPVHPVQPEEGEPPAPATASANAPARPPAPAGDGDGDGQASIELAWFDARQTLAPRQLPLTIGRFPDNGFVVSDQRVSRQHARIEWRDNAFVLTDLSSFGTLVRFAGGAEVHLRRDSCALRGSGEISLGAPFADFTGPVVAFNVRLGSSPSAAPALERALYEAAMG